MTCHRYGRRYTFFAALVLQALGQGVSAVAPNPYVYAVARLVAGAGVSGIHRLNKLFHIIKIYRERLFKILVGVIGCLSIAAIYSMEFLTPRYRPIAGSVGPWGEGVMLLAGLAYFVRPWRTLIWYSMVPYLLLLVLIP